MDRWVDSTRRLKSLDYNKGLLTSRNLTWVTYHL